MRHLTSSSMSKFLNNFISIIKKNSEFKEQSKVIKKESNSIQSNIDNESKIQKELIKRISDLEKSFKVFNKYLLSKKAL